MRRTIGEWQRCFPGALRVLLQGLTSVPAKQDNLFFAICQEHKCKACRIGVHDFWRSNTKQWLLISKKGEKKKVVEEPDFDLKW